MPTLTIKIASSGTPLLLEEAGSTSSVGHMWLSLDSDGPSGSNTTISRGFAPISQGTPIGPGRVYDNDDRNYGSIYYSGTLEITNEQYTKILNFCDHPENYGFSSFTITNLYNGLTNSCIDYVLKALQIGGLNDYGVLYGEVWPTWNANNADKLLFLNLFGELTKWDSTRTDNSGYNSYYGSNGNDNLISSIKSPGSPEIFIDAFYGGNGNDTLTGSIFQEFLYGGNDNDNLIGGRGNDYLEGGDGEDAYIYTSGDGFDTKAATVFRA